MSCARPLLSLPHCFLGAEDVCVCVACATTAVDILESMPVRSLSEFGTVLGVCARAADSAPRASRHAPAVGPATGATCNAACGRVRAHHLVVVVVVVGVVFRLLQRGGGAES